jgi:acetate kinase
MAGGVRALALNAGSSSLKAALYEIEPGAALAVPGAPLWAGAVDRDPGDRGAAARELLRELPDDVEAVVREVSELAPLHNAAGLEGVAVAEDRFAGAAQVAVFDTAFHSRLAPAARTYAGPREWAERGLRRYGFHGINHEYAAQRAAHLLGRPLGELRLITCHLGSGCSLAAIRGGRSVDTTMGFTPLEGVVMGTRAGSLDPGLLLHLLREPGASVDELDAVLHHGSGLRGLSGVSGDLREVVAARDRGDERARLAFDVYVHRLRFHLGAMLGALGGLDAVVFTAGVGEHSAEVRAAVLEPFAFLGVALDRERNAGPLLDCDVAAPGSPVRVVIARAQEEWAIARAAAGVAGPRRAPWEDGAQPKPAVPRRS